MGKHTASEIMKLKEDNKFYLSQIKSMGGQINKLTTKLDGFSDKQKEIDATSLISDAHKALSKAVILLDGVAVINGGVVESSLSSLKALIETSNTNPSILEVEYSAPQRIQR